MPEPIVLYEDTEDAVRLAARYEICPRCGGEGAHDAWDNGMSVSEMAEQGEDFVTDYFAGRYSVPCTVCQGKRVIAVPDELRCTAEQLTTWREYTEAEAEMRAERDAERRAGC
jgi:RecJ-like exonuclease